jgi:putative transposase
LTYFGFTVIITKQVMATLIRTIRFKVQADTATRVALLETIAVYTASFNRVAKVAWDNNITNGTALHRRTYYPERTISGMPSQLTISARMKAIEAIKSAKTLSKKTTKENLRRVKLNKSLTDGKRPLKLRNLPSMPQSVSQAVRYDKNSYTIWFNKSIASVLTLQGRKKINLVIPDYWKEVTSSWKATSAELFLDRQGVLWLHVVMQTEIDAVAPTERVVGIDLGIAHPATDSEGNHYGDVHWAVVEKRRKTHAGNLQRKGTKSAKRRLKQLSGTRNRFRANCDHILTKHLLAQVSPGDTIAFEDLTDIGLRTQQRGKEQRERAHSWSFDRLQTYVGYKALAKGVTVVYVDPRNTSRRCNCCGHIDKVNRVTQSRFVCQACGHLADADINAAKNIKDRYMASRAAVNQPMVGEEDA